MKQIYTLFFLVLNFYLIGYSQLKEEKTKVVLLGTGTPFADPERSGPSIAIVVNKVSSVVDCGPGVVRRASAAFRNGIKGLEASQQ